MFLLCSLGSKSQSGGNIWRLQDHSARCKRLRGRRLRVGANLKPEKKIFPDLSFFSSVKLGSGVLGKTAPVMVGLCAAIALIAWRLPEAYPFLIFGCAALVFLAVVGYICLSFWYAFRNPGAAVLEGANLVRYRQNEIATNDPGIIDISPKRSANTAPPRTLQVNTGGGDE